MIFLLAGVAVALTYAMFHTRSVMLGFPSAIFWALTGGQAYLLSTALWDIEYFLFFGSMGMTIFAMYASFAVRRADLDMIDDEDEKYIDEGKKNYKAEKSLDSEMPDLPPDGKEATKEAQPYRRTSELRARAERRRKKGVYRRDKLWV